MFTPFNVELPNSALNTYGKMRVLGGQPRRYILDNASRGLSEIAEFLGTVTFDLQVRGTRPSTCYRSGVEQGSYRSDFTIY